VLGFAERLPRDLHVHVVIARRRKRRLQSARWPDARQPRSLTSAACVPWAPAISPGRRRVTRGGSPTRSRLRPPGRGPPLATEAGLGLSAAHAGRRGTERKLAAAWARLAELHCAMGAEQCLAQPLEAKGGSGGQESLAASDNAAVEPRRWVLGVRTPDRVQIAATTSRARDSAKRVRPGCAFCTGSTCGDSA
jgi:hypothetical protein